MRKSIAIAISVGAFVLGAISTGFAGGGGRVKEPMDIHVVERAATDKVADVGRVGDSHGDILTFHNDLYDAKNDHQVGRDQGECIRISRALGLWECRWTAWIKGLGSLTVEGSFSDHHGTLLAITGGTGTFRNARGTMQLGFRDDPAEFDFIYHVIP
jgi:allene oxide cyclase